MSFGAKLLDASADHGRLCIGIDPHEKLLQAWGLPTNAEGVAEFAARCVEAFAGQVALVKPQVAFFERYGSAGYAALEKTLADLREAGTLTVADAKRGDIGSTMVGYAQAWLSDDSPLRADSVTLSPYLGVESLNPAVELAQRTDKGVFLLSSTSNPEARGLQNSRLSDGRRISQSVVDYCAARNAGQVNGSVGVVVGATVAKPPRLSDLHGPVLMPGVGAQGATAADVDRIAGKGSLAMPNVSRSVLAAGPDVADLRKAALDQAKQFPLRVA